MQEKPFSPLNLREATQDFIFKSFSVYTFCTFLFNKFKFITTANSHNYGSRSNSTND